MRFNVPGQVRLTIDLGRGGTGGVYQFRGTGDAWRSGFQGNNGENTTVNWNGNTLTVGGGNGGGERRGSNNECLEGGNGGTALRPSIISLDNWLTVQGGKGGTGAQRILVESLGGSAGNLNTGTFGSFGGGSGGRIINFNSGQNCDRGGNNGIRTDAGIGAGGTGGANSDTGMTGGHGRAIIVVTYFR
jgi:hypothetical protein